MYAVGKGGFGERRTAVEGGIADLCKAVSEGDGGEGAAVFKRLRADGGEALGQGEGGVQGAAALERLRADGAQPFGELYAREQRAPRKRLFPDLEDVGADGDGGHGDGIAERLVADAGDGQSAVGGGDDDVALRDAGTRNFKGGVAVDLAEGEPALLLPREGDGLRPGGVAVQIVGARGGFDADGVIARVQPFKGVGVGARIHLPRAALALDAHRVEVCARHGVPRKFQGDLVDVETGGGGEPRFARREQHEQGAQQHAYEQPCGTKFMNGHGCLLLHAVCAPSARG